MIAAIKTEGLTKFYGKVLGIQGLDLEVAEGEIFGFLGPNGSGKTTTIRVLTGFLRATNGSARVLGLDCWRDAIHIKARTGFLPDSPSIYGSFTGLELLDYLSRLQYGSQPVLRQELCDRLELSQEDLARKVKGYSRGMRQKLAIIQALQHDPELLMMDEPTEGLDPLMQQALFEVLFDFKARGRTIFFSSHILPEVERLCSRVGIIRKGSLVVVEEVQELRKRKLRQMELVLATESTDNYQDWPGVVSVERDGRRVRLLVRGEVNALLREVAKLDLEDMTFEQPDLEDIFLSYYKTEAEMDSDVHHSSQDP